MKKKSKRVSLLNKKITPFTDVVLGKFYTSQRPEGELILGKLKKKKPVAGTLPYL